jgi:hypothetical protein
MRKLMNKVQFDVGKVPFTYTRQNLVVLYGCNKGPKIGTLSNPRHQTLQVYALGNRVSDFGGFFIDLRTSLPTPRIWASNVYTKSSSINYSTILTHEHEKTNHIH